MDQRQIDLVQQSFARTERIRPHVAATFYAELFAIDPSLRPMFKGDIVLQGDKLMTMLNKVVSSLNEPEAVIDAARHLAVGHNAYGVEAKHYPMVGTALLRTLRHELGADFTSEVSAAWSSTYQWLSDVMVEAAYGTPSAA